MNRKSYIVLALSALMFTGCIDDTEDCPQVDDQMFLTAGISDGAEAQTRSTMEQNTTFDTGENISVFIKDAGTTGLRVYNSNKPITTTAGTVPTGRVNATGSTNALSFASGNEQYWPSNGAGVYVYAWYPVFATAEYGNFTANTVMTSDNLTFTIKADQSTAANYKKSDLMFGSYYNGSNIAACPRSAGTTTWNVPLSFKHKLSRVVVELTSGDGSPTVVNSTVTIGDATGGYLIDQVNLGILTGGNPTVPASSPHRMSTPLTLCAKDVAAKTGASKGWRSDTAYAVVPPQNVNGKVLTVVLPDGGTLKTTLPNVTLVAGSAYKFSVKVNLTGLTLTSTVEEWGSETTKTGNAWFYN